MLTHSIRWRLQLWLAFLLVCILTGFGFATYQLQRVNRFRQIDDELEKRVALLSNDRRRPGFHHGPGDFPPDGNHPPPMDQDGPPPIDRPPGPPPEDRPFGGDEHFNLSKEAATYFDQKETNSFYFAVWYRDGRELTHSTNAPASITWPEPPNDTRIHARTRDWQREAYHFTELGDCILVGRSIRTDLAELDRFKWILLGAGAVVLAFGSGVGWQLTSRSLKPIEQISSSAQRIAEGNLSERITVQDTDNEIGRLAGILNSTFSRLESAFTRQKQFTADAAHELRTPLAVLITETQTTLARERSAEEYRETVENCLETAQQMRGLTESLLQLARFDAGTDQSPKASVDLENIVRECITQIRPQAAQRDIHIHEEIASVKILSQSERTKQVVMNLVTNAIHYNKPNGEIRVVTRIENGFATLIVADTGVGIPSEDLPHIFERFYRADKSRSRSAGRYGLGLAICKAIVDADNGTIEATSDVGIGSKFIVRWRA